MQVQRTEKHFDGTKLHRYSQLVFRVTDSMGNRLTDYAIELIDGFGNAGQLPNGFIADKHKNKMNGEFFAFYLNYDRMREMKGGAFGFRIQVASNTPLIAHQDFVFKSSTGADALIKPNQSTFVDVVVKRWINKNVFRITKKFSYQKITNDASDEWVD